MYATCGNNLVFLMQYPVELAFRLLNTINSDLLPGFPRDAPAYG